MPATPSSLISSLSCAPALTVPETAGGLVAALAELPDPRARRGVRHRLTVVVIAAVCAVIAGSRSYTAIGEWVADVPASTALTLGFTPDRRPSEAMIRRLLQALDPQLLTAAISNWLTAQTITAAPGQRRAIAVDGKNAPRITHRQQCSPARPGRLRSERRHRPCLHRCRQQDQ